MNCICLNIKSFALSLGITWGLSMIFLGWVAALGWGVSLVELFSSFYVGFSATFIGGIIGGLWGFVLGMIIGAVIAFFYNLFAKVCVKEAKKK
ncbi:MAG: hypothetical protein AMS24_00660 [Chlamydiae bacterium SM23_39]|nr:MAG: hypothetical protein AMS24_00660 [Chlamydiae bacterium SM23_39]